MSDTEVITTWKTKDYKSITKKKDMLAATSRTVQHIQLGLRWVDVMEQLAFEAHTDADKQVAAIAQVKAGLAKMYQELAQLQEETVAELRELEKTVIRKREESERVRTSPKLSKVKATSSSGRQLPKSVIRRAEQLGYTKPESSKEENTVKA